jgi:phosphoglycerate dehydrogenase-like enzyme
MSPKIVVVENRNLLPDQIERLEKLGDTTIYDNMAKTSEEWLEKVKDANVICSGKFGLRDKYPKLKNVCISVPFVGVGWVDTGILKKNNITLSRSPGCNKDAVSEWIIGMMINLFRDLPESINKKRPGKVMEQIGITGKNVCILGKGHIGTRVGKICEALDMKVSYLTHSDSPIMKVKDADVIINCLSRNSSTEGLLNKDFFQSLKKGSFFINVTSKQIYDVNAMIEALDSGILAKVAIDAGSMEQGPEGDPFYERMQKHPKVLVTAHIAARTDVTTRVANDMMVDNVESFLKGKPINVVE